MVKEKGRLIVFSGPSGVGKSTVRKELFKNRALNLKYSISMTTRKIRDGEENHVDYHFVDEKQFLKAIKDNLFLEHAKFINNYYGTLKEDVDALLNKGYNVMLEIDVKGAKQIKKQDPNALMIFIIPPSFEILKERIISRKSEEKEIIDLRLKRAREEVKHKEEYDYIIINDLLIDAVEEVTNIIIKECNTK